MKIGFIGLGNVGGKLAGSLLRNNFDVTVRSKLFLNKLSASLPPTLPKPINPIFILLPHFFLFCKYN